MAEQDQELYSAQERVSHWRQSDAGIWRDRITMIGIDHESATLLVGANVPLPLKIRQLIQSRAGVPVHFVKAEVQFHQAAGGQSVRPLQGGTQIQDADSQVQGTLGLVVQSVTGDTGFLTAGHVVGEPNVPVGQPDSQPQNIVGKVVANNFIQPGTIDGAFVLIQGAAAATATVWQPGGTTLVLTGITEVPQVGTSCTMQGAVSGAVNGTIRFVNFEFSGLKRIALADYIGQAGDSGGPVYTTDASFLGVHIVQVSFEGHTLSGFTQVSGLQQVVNFSFGA
jgi:hypothetical protein